MAVAPLQPLRAVFGRILPRSNTPTLPPLDPRVRPIDLNSTALGIRKRFYIYTPPNHDPQRERVPVLYLFRGHETEWINPYQDPPRSGRTVIDVYEELLAARKV